MDLTVDTLRKLDADATTSYQAYQALETAARQNTATDRAAQRGAMAAFLASELNATDPGGKTAEGKDKPPEARYSKRVRNRVAQLLGIVGDAAEVPALATAMQELELRESARCALDRNRSEAATDALIASLAEIGPDFRVGVVGSLAKRAGEKVIRALQPLVDDEDTQVRLAALEAMAVLPEPQNEAAMLKLATSPCPCTRQAAAKARVRLAETLAKAGDKLSARRIWQAVRNSDADEPQKHAAERGLASLQ